VVVSVTGHIVISEVMVSSASTGGTAPDYEFVELYNPTDSDITMTGWRLSKKTGGGAESNLLTTFPAATIPAHGFFLIASPEYNGPVTADATYSTGNRLAIDHTVILYSDAGVTVVDKVGFGTVVDFETAAYSTNPDKKSGSVERKANMDSSAATMAAGGIDELEGNGYDTDNNSTDFINRSTDTANPQNTNSQREPAIANITLSNYDVSPDTGIATVSFTYTVQYKNIVSGNVAPDTKQIFIDGTAYNMVYQSGAYDVLATFQYSTTLSTGLHNYYFYFAKGPDSARAPETSPDVFNGPAVGPELEKISAYNPPTSNPADNTTVPVTASKTIYAYLATGSNNWSGYNAAIYWSTTPALGAVPPFTRSRAMTYAETNVNGYDVFYVVLSSATDYKAGMWLNYYIRAGDVNTNPKFTDDAGDTNADGWVSAADTNPNTLGPSCHYFKIDTAGPGTGMFDVMMVKKTEPCITNDAEKFTNDFSWIPGWRINNEVTVSSNNLTYNNEDIAINVSLSPLGVKANCTFYYTTTGVIPLTTHYSFSGGATQSNNNNWYKFDNATTGMSEIKAFFPSDLHSVGTTVWIYAVGYTGTGAGPFTQYFMHYSSAAPGTPIGDKDDAIVSGRGNSDGRYPTTDFNNYSPLRHSQNETIRSTSTLIPQVLEKYLYPNNPLFTGTTDRLQIDSSFLTQPQRADLPNQSDGITDLFYSDQVQFYLRTAFRDVSDVVGTPWSANQAFIVWLATTTDWSTAPKAALTNGSTSGDDNQPPHYLNYHWLIGENTGLEGYASNPSDCTKGAPEGATVRYIFKVRDNQSTGDFRWIYRDSTTRKQRIDITNSGTTAKTAGNQFEYKVLQDDITRPVAYLPMTIPSVGTITNGGVVPSTFTSPSWPTRVLGDTVTICGSTVETVKVYIGLFDTADGRFTASGLDRGTSMWIDNPNFVHNTFRDPVLAANNSLYFGNNVPAVNTSTSSANSGIKGGKTDNSDSYDEGLEGKNSEGRRVTHDVLLYYVWREPGSMSGGVIQPFSWINIDGTVNGSPAGDPTGTVLDSANQMIRIANVDGVANNSYVTDESSAATAGYISNRVSMAQYDVDPLTGNGIWVANIPAPSDYDIMHSTVVYLYYRIWACNGDNDPQSYYLETHGGLDTTGAFTYAGSHGNSITRGDLIENPYGKTYIDTSDDSNHTCGRVHDRDYGWVDITRFGGKITSPPRVMIKSKVTVGGVTRTITTYLKIDPVTRRPTNIISTQVGSE
ncbi:MAG: lamin tail domain-containing protein, partial [Elusimicrobiota bacterium]|nr:lamin tail domain-containing protein [Elusimicrobiota bacterium]